MSFHIDQLGALMRSYTDSADLPDLMKRADVAAYSASTAMRAAAVLVEDGRLIRALATTPKLRIEVALELHRAADDLWR